MLQHYAKRDSKLNRPLKGLAHSVFLTSPDGARYLYHSRTMVLRRVGGQPRKVRPSTCKTSSVGRFSAKPSWLRRGISWLLVTYRRLNPAFLRGLPITMNSYASSSQVVTPTHSSALRCSTSRASQKSRTPTFGSRLSPLYSALATVWDGHHLHPSYWSASWVRLLYGTSASSRKPWASLRNTLRSSWTTRTTLRR